MHTISTYEAGDEWIWRCSCGTQGNRYGTQSQAYDLGMSHKAYAEGDPDRDRKQQQSTIRGMGY